MNIKNLKVSILSMLVVSAMANAATATNSIVKTTKGDIQGIISSDDSVNIYKGIPYAKAPVGDLRWEATQANEKWTGVLQANKFGPGCMQNVGVERLPWTKEYLHSGELSEDCLYLNVWAPKNTESKKPVVVYIHGGGFVEGSGSVPIYDGVNLAKKGVVYVSLNYRLGAFGFISSSELQAENKTIANYGLLDQVMALKWIKENIANFGGDENNITIMGQSAGANSVLYLNATSLTKGLFNRSVIESPVPSFFTMFGVKTESLFSSPFTATTLAAQTAQVDDYLKKNGLSIKKLKTMNAVDVFKAFDPQKVYFGPVIGGNVNDKPLLESFSVVNSESRPIMLGVNKDELSGFFDEYRNGTEEQYKTYVKQNYPSNTAEILKLYPGNARKALNGDEAIVATHNLSKLLNKYTNAPVYTYFFKHESKASAHPEYGAFHTSEVPYITANLDKLHYKPTKADLVIESKMSTNLINFATYGTPDSGEKSWADVSNEKWLYVVDKKMHMSEGVSDNNQNEISKIGQK